MPTKEKLIGGFSEQHLLKSAAGIVAKKTEYCTVLDPVAEKRIPQFDESELKIGRVLGRGGFCVVQEISRIELVEKSVSSSHAIDEHQIQNVVQDRGFMEAYCVRKGKDFRYAIKRVQDSSRKDASQFVNAVVDLAIEARFLAVIRHPNIIKMRAMARVSPFTGNFFVVLDKLFDIMSTRLQKWKKSKVTGVKKMLDIGGKKEVAFWVERCTVAYDLAKALQYLHSMHIIYRDIKPDNIGFDVRGDVKIFDFGLAKEVDPSKKSADGTYRLTGDTGSPRYMAPEVALDKPYNSTVDVYGFCILFWQMLSLSTPFEGFNLNSLEKRVYKGGTRPKCDPKWPQEIVKVISNGWGNIIENRPSMEDIASVLQQDINKNSEFGVMEAMDASTKSEMSVRRNLKQ